MTHPHRWLRAAHKIAPNGALLPDTSYYRSDRTERSRPFPTNPPEVRNHPVRFIDNLPAETFCFSGFSVLFSSPPPCSSAKRPQSRCEKLFSLVRHLSRLHCSAHHRRSLPSCGTAGIFAYALGFSHRGLSLRFPVCKRPKSALFVRATLFPCSWTSKPHRGSQLPLRAFLLSPALPLIRSG